MHGVPHKPANMVYMRTTSRVSLIAKALEQTQPCVNKPLQMPPKLAMSCTGRPLWGSLLTKRELRAEVACREVLSATARFSLTPQTCRCLLARDRCDMAQSHATQALPGLPPVTCAWSDTLPASDISVIHISATELLIPPAISVAPRSIGR